jgi:hypothetical protein
MVNKSHKAIRNNAATMFASVTEEEDANDQDDGYVTASEFGDRDFESEEQARGTTSALIPSMLTYFPSDWSSCYSFC